MMNAHGLFSRELSCLLVIDVQQYFLDKLPLDQRQPLVSRIAWLMRVANLLAIPIVATAEDIARDGPLVPELASLLPPGSTVHDKMVFGLCGQSTIRDAVEAAGRREFILTGLETDVCIAQSALGLMEQGHRAAVIDDATSSPPPHHGHGIRRLAAAGAVITSVKGIYYEWVRDVATAAEVTRKLNAYLPPGLTL
jgi:nicotinamidase-related amidase